jgi:predicted PurR-regulated permease PerM
MLYFVSILLFDLLFLPILMALMLYALFRFGMGRLERATPRKGVPAPQAT